MWAGGGYISTALKLETGCLGSLYRKGTKRPKAKSRRFDDVDPDQSHTEPSGVTFGVTDALGFCETFVK